MTGVAVSYALGEVRSTRSYAGKALEIAQRLGFPEFVAPPTFEKVVGQFDCTSRGKL